MILSNLMNALFGINARPDLEQKQDAVVPVVKVSANPSVSELPKGKYDYDADVDAIRKKYGELKTGICIEAELQDLLKICEPGVIDKTRYLVKAGEHTFEVDEFYGDNDGLTVAEVELGSESEAFDKPEWLGEEVTGDVKYYNSMLMKNPYKNWK